MLDYLIVTYTHVNNLSFLNFSIADSVNIVNLPAWVPGANCSAFNLSTIAVSTPGMFFPACNKEHFCETTINGPVFFLYFLPLFFPLPARTFLTDALANSFYNPKESNNFSASFVFEIDSMLDSRKKG